MCCLRRFGEMAFLQLPGIVFDFGGNHVHGTDAAAFVLMDDFEIGGIVFFFKAFVLPCVRRFGFSFVHGRLCILFLCVTFTLFVIPIFPDQHHLPQKFIT